jgi:hypothetical protein
MHRRLFFTLAPALLLASVARASEGAKAAKTDVGQYVDLQPLAMPIIVKGQLLNYIFVYVRLNLTTGADATRLRQKEPFFRDALVRAGHRTPFVLATDYQKVDEAKLTAAMMREAAAIAGPGQVRSAVVTLQAPQRRVIMPRPSAPTPA